MVFMKNHHVWNTLYPTVYPRAPTYVRSPVRVCLTRTCINIYTEM